MSTYKEAIRYVQNAQEILSNKAKKEDRFYTDKKYVRMAGNTLWNGVLEALDYRFPEIKKGKGRPDINKYKEKVAKVNPKMIRLVMNAYDTLHLAMGYDGNLKYSLAQEGINDAIEIIEWATENNENKKN
ncbi:MAG: DUF5618 family protein [Bacteroidota bacterium]|nr:DUF5618 family protein [Bacteroidota bacterium]